MPITNKIFSTYSRSIVNPFFVLAHKDGSDLRAAQKDNSGPSMARRLAPLHFNVASP
jgi:hypothetical protein